MTTCGYFAEAHFLAHAKTPELVPFTEEDQEILLKARREILSLERHAGQEGTSKNNLNNLFVTFFLTCQLHQRDKVFIKLWSSYIL